jgi:hypothetical protein
VFKRRLPLLLVQSEAGEARETREIREAREETTR